MEELVYYTLLFDTYGDLLTDKQKLYFKDYYFKNLSLSELALKYNISRNAIHKQIKETIYKLEKYETNLHLILKNRKLEEIITTIKDPNLKEKLQEIIEL